MAMDINSPDYITIEDMGHNVYEYAMIKGSPRITQETNKAVYIFTDTPELVPDMKLFSKWIPKSQLRYDKLKQLWVSKWWCGCNGIKTSKE